jgi:2-methylcitrate dehydratase PrpD
MAGETARLAEGIRALASAPLPESARTPARRSLLNAIAAAVAGSRHASVEAVVTYGLRHGGDRVAPVPGRRERLDPYYAAMAAGLAAHVEDFDDMHLATLIHPGAAALGPLLALGAGVPGARALDAFALACEVELRVGLAVSPWQYDAGWHTTATCGVLGAAVGACVLLGLDAQGLTAALGLAASQTLGLRITHGTMAKALQPGKAAANGVLAALLAARGFTAAPDALAGARGYFAVLSPRVEATRLFDGLGTRWVLADNTIKPYPGGVVVHPLLDAALALRARVADLASIRAITARCHPLVLELTSDPDLADGMHALLSASHAIAVALLDGAAGLDQFSDARARAADVAELRNRVTLVRDDRVARDEAVVEVGLTDGGRMIEHVAHASGSVERPLDDAAVAAKAHALIEPVLAGRAAAIEAAVAELAAADAPDALFAAITPAT